MAIVGPVVWLIGLGWAIMVGAQIRHRMRVCQSVDRPYEVLAFLMALWIALVPALSLSPLHLLWLMPGSYVLGWCSLFFPFSVLNLPAMAYASALYVGTRSAGIAHFRAGEYEQAVQCLRIALEKDPRSQIDWFHLGLAHKRLRQWEQACEAFRACIRVGPQMAEAQCNLGHTLMDSGDLSGSIAAYEEAVRLRPDYVNALLGLGRAHLALGDVGAADAVVARLVDLDSEASEQLNGEICDGTKTTSG